MNKNVTKWLQISLFNLMLVALIGVILRYKITYSLPIVNQKNLLQSHSHFAFAGWVTQALMTLLISYLTEKGDQTAFKRYRLILYANLLTAYGMLVTFPFIGYALLSIIFSTLSIFVSYWFAIKYWRDLNRLLIKNNSNNWFKAAVIFNAISSIGAFLLAWMLATKNIQPDKYLASIYFFLHFQYNGWFFFCCMGLLVNQLYKYGASSKQLNIVFILFVSACIPAYLLSALWLQVPLWFYILVVIAVLLQLAGWLIIVRVTKKILPEIRKKIPVFTQRLFLLCAIALTIKLCLQSGSVIPSLSILAFGFRPIVIGYLHLVLLGVITLFIISYIFTLKLIPLTSIIKKGIVLFTVGIILNELLLMIQGVADLYYEVIPNINQMLLGAALVLFFGMFITNIGQKFNDKASNETLK